MVSVRHFVPVRVALACLCALLLVAPAARANVPGTSTTRLASRNADGRFPNGRSQDAAIAQDRKAASLVAYDSVATNIVAGDTNGVSDVFAIHRAQPYRRNAAHATSWEPGATELISKAMDGGPADGPSYLPDLDGDQLHDSHCVAFVSAADNLVAGDTNGQPDAFVRDLRTGTTTRVSVATGGGQADGPTTDVQVDGACDRVAFTTSASNLALTAGSGARKPLVTGAPPGGTRQVYVRILGGQPDDKGLAGTTFLASATGHGTPGNGDSYDAQLGELGHGCPKACGTTSGDAVAFASTATNLSPRDGNAQADVYEQTFRNQGGVRTRTRLMSARRSGQAGNGPSDQPAINDSGEHVAFRTAATDLVDTSGNGVSNIVMADADTGRLTLVSATAQGPHVGNGASASPSISRNASVLFASAADNLAVVPGADKNCVADVLFWNPVNRHLATESTDSSDLIPGSPNNPNADPCPVARTAPAENPATSYYNNFVAFEHSSPLIDLAVADAAYPGLRRDPVRAAQMAATDPTLHQVYMHLVGP